jgi:hypothetical protein
MLVILRHAMRVEIMEKCEEGHRRNACADGDYD